MDEYISRETAVDAGYLSDWYISSVGDEPPVWTEAHIDELLNDFIVIPKNTKVADVQPVKYGHWEEEDIMPYDNFVICSECGMNLSYQNYTKEEWQESFRYCPCCGARMDGDAE